MVMGERSPFRFRETTRLSALAAAHEIILSSRPATSFSLIHSIKGIPAHFEVCSKYPHPSILPLSQLIFYTCPWLALTDRKAWETIEILF